MKTVALFGGSFDPPHTGHEAIVEALVALKYIDEVVITPTFLNPFKSQSFAPSNLRLKWLRKIFSSVIKVTVDDYEVNLGKKVPTIKTVKYLLDSFDKVFVVIGADNVQDIHQWHKYNELKELVTFIVALRGDETIDKRYITLPIDENISSTQLRKKINTEKLPSKCANEIAQFYKEYNARQN